MPKEKAHGTENQWAKECWNTKQNLHLGWSVLPPIVQPAIRRSLSFFCAAGSILSQFKVIICLENHDTHSRNACLRIYRIAISLWPPNLKWLRNWEGLRSTRQIQRLCCLAFLASFPAVSVTPRDALSRAHDGHGAKVTNEWKIIMGYTEIFDTKDGAANFKKITRV